MRYLLQKLTCFFVGHDWYIVDYIFGVETKDIFNIKECGRCRKAELD